MTPSVVQGFVVSVLHEQSYSTLLCQDCWSPAGPLFSFSFFCTCQQGLGSGTLNTWGDTMASLVHGCLEFFL